MGCRYPSQILASSIEKGENQQKTLRYVAWSPGGIVLAEMRKG